MKKDDLLMLGDNLESKLRLLDHRKDYIMKGDWIDLEMEEQVAYINEIKRLEREVVYLKEKINKLGEENSLLKSKYNRIIQDGDLWLGDVLDIEKPEFCSNNLILAPVGSGKSYTIHRKLANKGSKYQLMLVPSSYLKESIAPNILSKRERDGNNVFTTGSKVSFGDNDYKIHVMTYAEFGWRIRNNSNFIKENNIREIYCDEIHSLIEYKNYSKDESLAHALRYLFLKHENIQIFYFTATTEYLDSLKNRDPEKFAYLKVFNYLDYPNIKKYTNKSEYKINHLSQLRKHLKAHSGDFISYGYKGLVYHKTISGQKKIAEMLKEEGFSPLVLWSTKTTSEHGEMDSEQLRCLTELIETERIPEGYNFLVINSAMREGWNLQDEKVELAIVNTISETDQVQARGRIRKNISTFIYRVDSKDTIVNKLDIDYSYLNRPLTTEDKDKLCKELSIYNKDGAIAKWTTLKPIIISEGYKVEEKRVWVGDKQLRVSIIKKH